MNVTVRWFELLIILRNMNKCKNRPSNWLVTDRNVKESNNQLFLSFTYAIWRFIKLKSIFPNSLVYKIRTFRKIFAGNSIGGNYRMTWKSVEGTLSQRRINGYGIVLHIHNNLTAEIFYSKRIFTLSQHMMEFFAYSRKLLETFDFSVSINDFGLTLKIKDIRSRQW